MTFMGYPGLLYVPSLSFSIPAKVLRWSRRQEGKKIRLRTVRLTCDVKRKLPKSPTGSCLKVSLSHKLLWCTWKSAEYCFQWWGCWFNSALVQFYFLTYACQCVINHAFSLRFSITPHALAPTKHRRGSLPLHMSNMRSGEVGIGSIRGDSVGGETRSCLYPPANKLDRQQRRIWKSGTSPLRKNEGILHKINEI